jgi:hypothetical protein
MKKETCHTATNRTSFVLRSRVEWVVDPERVDRGLALLLRRLMGETNEPQPLSEPGDGLTEIRRS